MDYSDDEAERSAKSKRKAKHKADQEGNDEDEKSRHELPNKNRYLSHNYYVIYTRGNGGPIAIKDIVW